MTQLIRRHAVRHIPLGSDESYSITVSLPCEPWEQGEPHDPGGRVMYLRSLGWSQRRIARDLQLAESSVRRILRKNEQ